MNKNKRAWTNRTNQAQGDGFEQIVEMANHQYRYKKIALITKNNVEWVVGRGPGEQIKYAYPKEKAIVDYTGFVVEKWEDGTAKRHDVAFDTKSTRNAEKKFILKGVEKHQVEFLREWEEMGGVSFILVELILTRETYFVNLALLERWLELHGWNGAVKHEEFQKDAVLVKSKNGIILDYLEGLY